MKRTLSLLFASALAAVAQTTVFTSDFNANTGAAVLAGNTDNTSGSASLGVTWTKHAAVSAVSGLTAISTGDSGTAGGFARLQGGSATYANANNVFISRNHNLDSNRATSKRGFSFTFTTGGSWDLGTLTVLSGHTNNSGNQDQDFSSKLNISISGGTLGSPVTASSTENYATAPAYHTVNFNLAGNTLGPGTYTVEVWQSDMPGGGAYAMYDGITLTATPAGMPTIESFTADDHYVTPGSGVTLAWETTDATTISIDQGIGDVTGQSTDGDGSKNVNVSATTTYTLTATNAAGSTVMTVKVAAGPSRPNILFFVVDDMGANDTSVPFRVDGAGNDVPSTPNGIYRTPQMEALAAQGMKFTRAYAMPVCTPTRNSLMNGQNSARHHVTNWTGPNYNEETGQNSTPSHNSPREWRRTGLDTSAPTLAGLLSDAGYRSIHVGKGHFGNAPGNINPLDIGFDVNIGGKQTGRPGSYYGTSNFGSGTYQVPHLQAYHGQNIFLTEALTLEMNKEIEKAVDAGVPFFAYMSHYAVHDPYDIDPRFAANYPSLSGNAKAFATLLEGMDKSLGDIRTKLSSLGVAEDTLVIFISDNGSTLPLPSDPLRGYKGQKYEGGTRVPMITAWASPNPANAFQSQLNIPAGSHETDIVSCIDLFPTILGVANVSHSNVIDGHDLREYFKGTPGNHRPQELLIHFPHDHNGAWGDYYSVYHEGDYKLIYNYAADSYELYNVVTDVHEDTNLAAGNPGRVMAMARKMARQLHAHGAQWPTFDTSPTDTDDPFAMPILPGVDLDGDGIDDNDEDTNNNGLVDPGETDPDNNNTDGDNVKDGDEAALGLDPLDQNSYFYLHLKTLPGNELCLTWPSAPGALFTIRSSTDLADWSTIVASGVNAASPGDSTSYNLGIPEGLGSFYRVELE